MLQGAGGLLVSPFVWTRAAAAERALTFLAVGDWGRDGKFNQAEVARQMGVAAHRLGARFVLSVGDNFYEEGVASTADPKWLTSFESVYAAKSLHVPWYAALGNHDYYGGGEPQAQVDFTHHSKRWRMPARDYSFAETSPHGVSVEVFVLDTIPMIPGYRQREVLRAKLAGQDPDAQTQRFAARLAASTADWKVVVGHHPIWCGDNSQAGREGHSGSPDLVARLDPLLKAHGVHLYLNGHDHDLQHTEHAGIHYVCTGAGSSTLDTCEVPATDFCSGQPGFVACAVTHEALQVRFWDVGGRVLKVVDIPRSA
jgi:acid phosphatase